MKPHEEFFNLGLSRLSQVFYGMAALKIFWKFYKKTTVMVFFSSEIIDCNFTFKVLHLRFFPLNTAKYFRVAFL